MEIVKKIKLTYPNLALFTLGLELEHYLRDCESVLDLGCGSDSPLKLVSKKKSVGVDAHNPSIKLSRKKGIHDDYVYLDVAKVASKFKPKSFDAVIALDLIEHLTKKQGNRLLSDMEKIAKKSVILLTPNGFIDQQDDENTYQEHLSGWTARDFHRRKYRVYGRYGLSFLRGEKAALRFRPKIFWGLVSELSNWLFSRYVTSTSFSLLAVKKV